MVTNPIIFVTRFVTRFCYALSPLILLIFNYFSLLANICYKVTKISVKIRVEGVRGEAGQWGRRLEKWQKNGRAPEKIDTGARLHQLEKMLLCWVVFVIH